MFFEFGLIFGMELYKLVADIFSRFLTLALFRIMTRVFGLNFLVMDCSVFVDGLSE